MEYQLIDLVSPELIGMLVGLSIIGIIWLLFNTHKWYKYVRGFISLCSVIGIFGIVYNYNPLMFYGFVIAGIVIIMVLVDSIKKGLN